MTRSEGSGLNDKELMLPSRLRAAQESRPTVAFHIVARQAGNYCVFRSIILSKKHRPSPSFNEQVQASKWRGVSSCTGHKLAEA